MIRLSLANLCAGLMAAATAAGAAGRDLGNGFRDHGVATPVSNRRGIVACRDKRGHDVVLIWLFDHRGGYALLMVDVDTGRSRQFKTPFPPRGDCPYASLLSSKNRYYTHFAGHFVEFDPEKPGFTFSHATRPQMAMSMTEDDKGRIWSVTYPNSGVVCYDPARRSFRDYGWVHRENWYQYPRYVAADDAGWIYFGLGNTESQIVILDPKTGEARTVLPESERVRGCAVVVRDRNGKVYGRNGGKIWYELYRGKARKIPRPARLRPKPIITGTQSLFYRRFPDGRRLVVCDTVKRRILVADPKTGKKKELSFDYTSDGAYIMGVAAAPNHTLCGGTSFPMRFFSYDPKTDAWINRAAYGQWNTVARQGSHFFVGGYTHGFLLDWDPAEPWVPTVAVGQNAETIGWGYTGTDYYHFHGKIDEVRLYDRALAPEEIGRRTRRGLVAYWPFDEGRGQTAADASGRGNAARLHGAKWTAGKRGNALEFDGKTACVQVPDAPALHFGTAFTFEAWVYPTPPHQHGYGGLINNIAGHANSRLLVLDSGTPQAQVFIGDKRADNIFGPPLRNNAWNHVAFVYDGRRQYWIVNGKPGKKTPASGPLYIECNPKFLTQCHPDINRPHDLLAYPDGHTLILAGTPGYGYTGGGLLFWDRRSHSRVLRTHRELLPEQATLSLAPLPGNRILGGSTTSPGTGGEKKAKQAELYILDLGTKSILWHAPVFPGAQGYTDLCPGPRGLIYGVVDRTRFFVFDPATRAVVHQKLLPKKYGPCVSQQGPRAFVRTPQGETYLLLVHAILRIDPRTYRLRVMAESPVPISAGGDFYDGRIYFASGSHLYSWAVPASSR